MRLFIVPMSLVLFCKLHIASTKRPLIHFRHISRYRKGFATEPHLFATRCASSLDSSVPGPVSVATMEISGKLNVPLDPILAPPKVDFAQNRV